MLCLKPIFKGVMPFACGQCMPCRINRRRVWTARMMLELHKHQRAVFVTLTYAPDHLPEHGSVVKRDFQLFMKRLRKSLEPRVIRFFAVGEYGEKTLRPHYHAILYGVGHEDNESLLSAWPFGLLHIGSVTADSCQYVAGYVCKKLTSKDDPRLKPGQEPEFTLMSRRPGIGAHMAQEIAQQMTRSRGGAEWINKNGDVPKIYRMENGFWPLGRYLVEKIRVGCGFEDGNAPARKKDEFIAQMSALRDTVGAAAYKGTRPFVDWAKADKVVDKWKRNTRKML